jgi:hypothetical protein
METEEGANTFVVRFTIGDGPRAVALDGSIEIGGGPKQVQRPLSNYAQLMVLNETEDTIAWFGEAQKPNNTFMLTRFNGFVFDKEYRFFLVQGSKAGLEPPTLLAAGLSEKITIPSHAVTEIEITMHCIDVKPSFISGGNEATTAVNGVFQLAGTTWQAVWKIRGLDALYGLGEFQIPGSFTFEETKSEVSTTVSGNGGTAYFNLKYSPLPNAWTGFNNGDVPEWIIRNGLNDALQDGNTNFRALAGGDSAKNGNGAVRFTVAAPPPANPGLDQTLQITKPLKTPVDGTDVKIEFTLNRGGTVYYTVIDKDDDLAAPSAYTSPSGPFTGPGTFTTAGTFPGPGTYEITLTMSDTQDVVWLILVDSSGVRSKAVEAPSLMTNAEAEAYLSRAQVGRDSADPPVHLPLDATVNHSEANTLINKMKYVDPYLSFTGPIPIDVFRNNQKLQSLSAPDLEKIEDGDWPDTGPFWNCTALETVDLPKATYIGNDAFRECTALKTANLPVATYIGQCAFDVCTSLTMVNIPNAETLGKAAFWKCTSLTTLYIPKVTCIGEEAFERCISLTTLYLGADPPDILISSNPFKEDLGVFHDTGSGTLTIVVPPGSKAAYDQWVSENNGMWGTNRKTIRIVEGTYPLNP